MHTLTTDGWQLHTYYIFFKKNYIEFDNVN